ncbi:hypothetical protein B0T17DRAFT_56906 [Bombardia bombarda]|uniref:Uncharacterized protein n=1 Tax=Bombardia bombarda TaxID=252184 RepID=A0AA40CEG4_9PEZI|nr:hypothetical protein B0T17DRAFT_56906 [Bombardia bombarda]
MADRHTVSTQHNLSHPSPPPTPIMPLAETPPGAMMQARGMAAGVAYTRGVRLRTTKREKKGDVRSCCLLHSFLFFFFLSHGPASTGRKFARSRYIFWYWLAGWMDGIWLSPLFCDASRGTFN